MVDLVPFAARPPLRCFELVDLRTGARCGAPAAYARRSDGARPIGYFCFAHSLPTDATIAADDVFRRVSITVDVLFSAVSWDRSIAHAEVLSRLEALVAEAGGVINLHACRSHVGHVAPLPARQTARALAGES